MAWAKAYGHKLAQSYCAAGLKPKAMAMAQAPSWAMAQDPGNVDYAPSWAMAQDPGNVAYAYC